jgi:hypothetical protein
VVDQMRGALVPCDWIETGLLNIGPARVTIARLAVGLPKKNMDQPTGLEL